MKKYCNSLLSCAGLVLQIIFLAYMIMAMNASEEPYPDSMMTPASRYALISLMAAAVCEMLYLLEAAWSLSEEGGRFHLIRLLTVSVSAVLLLTMLYTGTVQTIACNAVMAVVGVMEIGAVIRRWKRGRNIETGKGKKE